MRLEARKVASIASLLADSDRAVFYSVINPWELSIKHAKGKLKVPSNFFETFSTLGFECLPIEESHVQTLRELPPLHDDPFDRMLVAQAKVEKLTLITSDKRLAQYPVKTLLLQT